MRVLLDTHALLWFSTADPKLSQQAGDIIADTGNELLFSYASVWEIAIKSSIGKLPLSQPVDSFLAAARRNVAFNYLRIKLVHLTATETLPLHHRDPFDRLLVSQALAEDLPLLTRDKQFSTYGVNVLW